MLNFGIADVNTILADPWGRYPWQLVTFADGARIYCEAGTRICDTFSASDAQARSVSARKNGGAAHAKDNQYARWSINKSR